MTILVLLVAGVLAVVYARRTEQPVIDVLTSPFRTSRWLAVPALLAALVWAGKVSFATLLLVTLVMFTLRVVYVRRHPPPPVTVPVEVADEVDPEEVDYDRIDALVRSWPRVAEAVGVSERREVEHRPPSRREAKWLVNDPDYARAHRIEQLHSRRRSGASCHPRWRKC